MPPINHDQTKFVDDQFADEVLALFGSICDSTAAALAANVDWSESGRRAGQYRIDLDVDALCVEPLLNAGFEVLSEESGRQGAAGGRGLVVVDPLDGSTNASLGLPWCATALCLVIDNVPTISMVANLVTRDRYTAVRGSGAQRNGAALGVDAPRALGDAVIAVNGLPPRHGGWAQYRALGAAALDIVAVVRGAFGGYVDMTTDEHGVWDYLASLLVVVEAGGVAVDAFDRDLVVLDHAARRTPVVAASQALVDELLVARRS